MNRRSLILGAAALPLASLPIPAVAHGSDDPVVGDIVDVYEQDFLPFDTTPSISETINQYYRALRWEQEQAFFRQRQEYWHYVGSEDWEDYAGTLVTRLPYGDYGWTWSNEIEQRIYPSLWYGHREVEAFALFHLEGRDTPSVVTKIYDDGSYLVLHTPRGLWMPSSIARNAW